MDEGKAAGQRPTWWSRPRGVSAPRPVAKDARTARGAPAPLHGEDPYGTPPYGGPGPWAPAPPVQRPTATPARGTLLPPQAQAAGPAPEHTAGSVPEHAAGHTASPGVFARYDPWAPPSAAPRPSAPHTTRPPHPEAPSRRRGRPAATVAGAVLLALVAGTVGGGIGAYAQRQGDIGTVRLSQAPAQDTGRAPDSVAGIAGRALPGVVTIQVRGAGEPGELGTGTGFVLDGRGHLLTNHHVVESAGNGNGDGGGVRVVFHGGETATAEIVGTDSGYDLAVLRVEGVSGLSPLPLGNSDSVRVGDPVVAIGAPYGLAGTVTTGIVSATERPVTAGGEGEGGGSDISYVEALQTDAPINPGNSGGPLMDAGGRVIGVNSAIRSAGGDLPRADTGGSIGLGFAIPVNQARRVAEELINTGRATHPVIGVTIDMGHPAEGARVGLPAGREGTAVVPGGPADTAGIEEGDVITEVDGVRVRSGEELIVRIRARRPGDRLELTVERGGGRRSVEVVLGSAGGP
ncbi:trypsin-like peptidase domain-containing protein [Streptomyces barkulensis]|uniref:trypsin-like peptidase domain-containing protein n=1 Tax=Streptomyces barkulensis TaxID=1257026 RepID=UPI000C6CE542|nr:trypsin-like peptidase domain-containing protein [Streptomyces barkulensis]